jgi:FkbM family methyltransferase
MNFAIQLQTGYGPFLMSRHDIHQPYAVLRTGWPHITGEIEMLLSLVDRMEPGAVVLDIGANIGLISIPLGRRLAEMEGSVLAFEPQRLMFYMLAGNVVANGLENVFCHQVAISDRVERLSVPAVDYHSALDFGMVQLREAGAGPGEEVPATSIDDLNLGRVDLMKIDVELMESRVLAGARKTLERCRPLVWVEAWPSQRADLYKMLVDFGYGVFVADQLNLFAVPEEMLQRGYEVKLPEFDGDHFPFA